jgi:allophanate hydrolase
LAGAAEGAAGLEILLAAPGFYVESGPVRVGLAGALSGRVTRADGAVQRIESFSGITLLAGDRLALKLARGPAYLGFSGGLHVPRFLHSRSTYARAGFGGLEGRALRAGDALACAPGEGDVLAPPLAHESGPIRFIPGPQDAFFAPDALAVFQSAEWRVGADSDRMGMRLSGPRLAHGPRGANIVTDGATPGAIQVPGDGQPIILRADGQTSGGYAKIGCVIAADLPRLAHFALGEACRFRAVTHEEAGAARAQARKNFAQWRAQIGPAPRGWDAEKLWTENLISGATFGD